MSLDPKKNFAVCTVSTGYAAGATTVVLSTGHGAKLPAPSSDGAFNLVWYDTAYATPSADPLVEIVRVTAKSGDTLTITRAQEGTTDNNHNAAGKTHAMILGVTAKDFSDMNTALVQGTAVPIYTDSSAVANLITVTTGLGLTSLTHGMRFRVLMANTITSDSVGLTVDSCATKAVAVAGIVEGLILGTLQSSLVADRPYDFVYDSTIFGGVGAFLVTSPTIGIIAPFAQGKLWHLTDDSAAANTILLTSVIGSNIDRLVAGATVSFVADYANTGACTVNVDGTGAVALYGPDGLDLMPGTIQAGAVVILQHDGTNWRLCGGGKDKSRYGEITMVGNVTATVIGATSTFYQAAGTMTLGEKSTEPGGTGTFTKDTTGGIDTLLYNGPSGRTFKIQAHVCMSCPNNTQVLELAIGINGTAQAKTEVDFSYGIGGNHDTLATGGIFTLSVGDKITVMVGNDTATNNITVDELNIQVTELP